MDWVGRIAEEKIKEAMANGEFDNLPGHGKPLKMEDLSGVPEELGAAYKILKNVKTSRSGKLTEKSCASICS